MGFRSQFAGQATADGTNVGTLTRVTTGSSSVTVEGALAESERLRVFRLVVTGYLWLHAAAAATTAVGWLVEFHETSPADALIGQTDLVVAGIDGSVAFANANWSFLDLPRGVILPNGAGVRVDFFVSLLDGSAAQDLRAHVGTGLYYKVESA